MSGRPKIFLSWLLGSWLLSLTGSPTPILAQPAVETPPVEEVPHEVLRGSEVSEERIRELQTSLRHLIQQARDRVLGSLVHIQGVTVMHFEGTQRRHSVVGSGTLISSGGHILTNQHVTGDTEDFQCTLADRQKVPCRLVGEDPVTDLAVLQLDRTELEDPEAVLPVAELGDSSRLEVGDHVLAMGSPFALSRTVTLGIVSHLERVFSGGLGDTDPDDMEIEPGQRTGLYTRWIQHDALINPGNSGGPLVDLSGRVVGVNELGSAAMGFAIPSNLAQRVADALIADGRVTRSWIGIRFRRIEGTDYEQGVLVEAVIEDGPAALAGLMPGDVVIRLGEEPVNARFAEEVPVLETRIADLPVGTEIEVAFLREAEDGVEERTGRLVTAERREDRGRETTLRIWGIGIEEITPRMARNLRLDSQEGARISGVRSGGPAYRAEPSLEAGDILRRVGSRKIGGFDDLLDVHRQLTENRDSREPVLVEFHRKGKSYVTLLEGRDDDDRPPSRELPKAWMGIDTQPVVQELAEKLGVPEARGYRITRVYPGTGAAHAGLVVGDILIALEGEALEPAGIQDSGLLARRIRRLPIGSTAALTLVRDGERRDMDVPLDRSRLSPEQAPRSHDRNFELTVRPITYFDRDENRWHDEVRGVLVVRVDSAGWAGLGGVKPGDLVQRMGERTIESVEDFDSALAEIGETRPERVRMIVLRGTRTQFLFLEPTWEPDLVEETEQEDDT